MRKLISNPLAWMVLAEIVVVAALVVVAWNIVASAQRPSAGPHAVAPPAAVADNPSPTPDLPKFTTPPRQLQLPGLNLDPQFWRIRLDQLNRDQVWLEQLEWRLVHGAMDTVKRYLDTVVLPAIKRAEGARSLGVF